MTYSPWPVCRKAWQNAASISLVVIFCTVFARASVTAIEIEVIPDLHSICPG